MSALLEENPSYKAITVMRVDWYANKDEPLVKELSVNHRATLIMLKDGKELGRVLWSASKDAIEPLFKAAL